MPRPTGDDRVPSQAALPPGAVAGGQRAPDRNAADRPARRKAVPSRSGAASRSTTRGRPAQTSSPPARSPRRGRERPSSSRTRASTTSVCGRISCGRRRWPSTSSATSPPTSSSPTGPSTPGGRMRPAPCSEVRFAHSPGRFDPAYLNSLRAFDAAFVLDLGDGTRGIVGVDTKYHERMKPEIPKPSQPLALPGGRREVGRLRARGDRRGQGQVRARRDVARAPAAAVDAPARERTWTWGRYVVVHPAGNTRLRRSVRPVPSAARGPVDVLLRDRRGAPRRRRSSRRRRSPPCAIGIYPPKAPRPDASHLSPAAAARRDAECSGMCLERAGRYRHAASSGCRTRTRCSR